MDFNADEIPPSDGRSVKLQFWNKKQWNKHIRARAEGLQGLYGF